LLKIYLIEKIVLLPECSYVITSLILVGDITDTNWKWISFYVEKIKNLFFDFDLNILDNTEETVKSVYNKLGNDKIYIFFKF